MNKLLLDDEELLIVFLSSSLLKDEEEVPKIVKDIIHRIERKMEIHYRENPGSMRGILNVFESDDRLKNHPRGSKLFELVRHLVAAYDLTEEIKATKEDCNLCDGAGVFKNGSGLPCPRCGGTGKLNKKETYN